MVTFNPSWSSIKLTESPFFSWPEGEVLRGVLPALRDAGGVTWFPGGGGGVILWTAGEWLTTPFPFAATAGGVGLWLCTGYKGGVMWPTGGWYGNDGGGVTWPNGGIDGWGRRGPVAVVKGGVIGWNICGELWLSWWSSKWSLISAVERMLCNGAVLTGSKLWFLRSNRGCPRFPERLSVDLAWTVGEFKACEEFTAAWLVFDVAASVNEGVDMLLVNTAGIDGAPRKLLTTGAVVVTGGGGVKRGCVKPLRFRPATPENKIKILDSYSFFHVNLKNTVGHR